jgi:integrase
MRRSSSDRDAHLISVLAYAGLRPEEVLALCWEDLREETLLVERAVAFGTVKATKNRRRRAVRLLGPLKADLREWSLLNGRPAGAELVFPAHDGALWGKSAWDNWRNRAFKKALTAAGIERARPYDLRHSFASLLYAEGHTDHYVAKQLGNSPKLASEIYGHVIEEFEGVPRVDAEEQILAARAALVPEMYPRGRPNERHGEPEERAPAS